MVPGRKMTLTAPFGMLSLPSCGVMPSWAARWTADHPTAGEGATASGVGEDPLAGFLRPVSGGGGLERKDGTVDELATAEGSTRDELAVASEVETRSRELVEWIRLARPTAAADRLAPCEEHVRIIPQQNRKGNENETGSNQGWC
jgi:hypothetical protein